MILISIVIFIISLVLAAKSMNDLRFPVDIQHLLKRNRIKGSIIFFKKRIKHYRA